MSDLFERNFSLLRSLDSALAERMARVPWPPTAARPVSAKNGAPTLKALAHEGAEILVHSEYDPVQEARQFLDVRSPGRHEAYILSGFGLGYAALELSARLEPWRWVLCVEAREDLFRAALETVDLGPLLSRKRARFFVGHNWMDFQRALCAFLAESEAMDVALLTWPPCARLLPQFYANAGTEIETAVNRRRVEINTLVHHAASMERNAVRNLATLARSHGVREFEGLLTGVPAVVVAAGPSLNAALPDLRRAKGRAVIICVGKALKLLLENGIVPDFVAHLDMVPESANYFRGFEMPPEVALVFDPDCFHEVPEAHPGPRIGYETVVPLNRWSRAFLGEKGILDKGLSVAHTAFFFIRATGAGPILLTGVDLAFPGERTHAEGVTMTWGGRTDEKPYEWIRVPGADGKPVRTLPSFYSFVTAFEVEILKTPTRIVQTSPNGAFIRGAEHRPLSEAVGHYLAREQPVAEKLRAAFSRTPNFDVKAFGEAGRRALAGMARAAEQAETGLRYSRQLRRLDPSNKLEQEDFRKIFGKAQALRGEMLKDQEVGLLLQRLLSPTAVEIRSLLREIDQSPPRDRAALLKLEFRQFEAFFNGYQEAVAFFRNEFGALYERMVKKNAS